MFIYLIILLEIKVFITCSILKNVTTRSRKIKNKHLHHSGHFGLSQQEKHRCKQTTLRMALFNYNQVVKLLLNVLFNIQPEKKQKKQTCFI